MLLEQVKKFKLDKRTAMGIVRHSLTFIGGLLIMGGIFTESGLINEIVGSFVTLFGLVWSVIEKNNN